jgi:hypothetical protein
MSEYKDSERAGAAPLNEHPRPRGYAACVILTLHMPVVQLLTLSLADILAGVSIAK